MTEIRFAMPRRNIRNLKTQDPWFLTYVCNTLDVKKGDKRNLDLLSEGRSDAMAKA